MIHRLILKVFLSESIVRISIFGKNFNTNLFYHFAYSEIVKFGDDVLVGSYVCVRDNDGHNLFISGSDSPYNKAKNVKIGNNVWLASNVDRLKGALIPNYCVVGYRNCVLQQFEDIHCCSIGDYPAKVIKKNIR